MTVTQSSYQKSFRMQIGNSVPCICASDQIHFSAGGRGGGWGERNLWLTPAEQGPCLGELQDTTLLMCSALCHPKPSS